MKRHLISPKAAGILLFLVMGVAKLPLEDRLTTSLREQSLLQAPPDFSLRESLGQMSFAAALGGLRSLIASITYLQAYVAFENVEWGKVDSLLALTTRLQPREVSYWDDASWHMAYNAASNTLQDKNLRAALKTKQFNDYVQRGIQIASEGLQYLPDDPTLLVRLAGIYKDRVVDHRRAGDLYIKAYAHGARTFHERMGAYELVKVDDPVAWATAYEILKRYFDQGKHYSSILRDLPILEEKLNIPADKRIPRGLKPD